MDGLVLLSLALAFSCAVALGQYPGQPTLLQSRLQTLESLQTETAVPSLLLFTFLHAGWH